MFALFDVFPSIFAKADIVGRLRSRVFFLREEDNRGKRRKLSADHPVTGSSASPLLPLQR
jgi:hypothetical protein